MKCSVLRFLLIASVVVAAVPAGLGQDDSQGKINLPTLVVPLRGGNRKAILEQSAAGKELAMWTYKVKSTRQGSKGQPFTGTMVGKSPLTNNGTTTITMQIIPMILDIQGTTFDPTVPDNNCAGGKVPLDLVMQSPMVLPANIKMNGVNVGKAQYIDAFQRANFWTPISKNGGGYHTKLKVVTLKPVKLDPGSNGAIVSHGCGPVGGVEFNFFDNYVKTKLIPSLKSQGVGPNTIPMIMFYNSVWYCGNPSNLCAGGWHEAYQVGNLVQTYSPFAFDLSGVFIGGNTYFMSHEVGELVNDPLGGNPVPAWGHVGQVNGCQNNLEVGDPLTGTKAIQVKMPNGYTYHLQELAFFSWFFGPPSIGAGHKFSNEGTFTSAQGACQ